MVRLRSRVDPVWLAAAVVVAAVGAAYWNSLRAPFVFDDFQAITENPSIKTLWPLSVPLSPPDAATGAAGRPVVNFSLALNYAIGGENVVGYHMFNVLVHAAAALVVFGLVRRTLLPVRGESGHAGARWLTAGGSEHPMLVAFAIALLWALHPLQTESVTCVIQRSESLGGLFYLLTLYCFVRATESDAGRAWPVLCVTACLCGMASKEVMVSAPLLALLYDRTFVAGTFREAWERRWRLYLALGATWLLLAWLVAGHAQRGGAAGFGLGVSWWEYLLTQCRAIVLYLKLAVWPDPLVLDYGDAVVRDPLAVWPQALLLVALAVGTAIALWRRPVIGFVGVWFFALLAPSSSVVPLVTQTMAEHRMYLPLLAVVVLFASGTHALLRRWTLAVVLPLALGCAVLTARRNHDFRTEIAIWSDTVQKRPTSPRARYNLGTALDAADRSAEAMRQYREAIRLKPDYADAHFNLGNAFARQRDFAPAVRSYEAALRWDPDSFDVRINLGNALIQLGLFPEAVELFRALVVSHPDAPEVRRNLANALQHAGQDEPALAELRAWVRLSPRDAAAHYHLGNALALTARWAEACDAYRAALALEPARPRVHTNLGGALLALGRDAEARAALETALRLDPRDEVAAASLAEVRARVRP